MFAVVGYPGLRREALPLAKKVRNDVLTSWQLDDRRRSGRTAPRTNCAACCHGATPGHQSARLGCVRGLSGLHNCRFGYLREGPRYAIDRWTRSIILLSTAQEFGPPRPG